MSHATAKLKICIASSGLGHVHRGVEAWASDLGHALAKQGRDVLLCKGGGVPQASYERVVPCLTRNSPWNQRIVRWLPKRIGWRLGVGGAYGVEQTSFAWKLIGMLRRQRIDIVHLQDPQLALLIQRAQQAGWIPTRVILNHGTEEDFDFLKKLTFVQHGAPWHQHDAQALGVWKDSWTMIPNFVDTERFRPGTNAALRRELHIPNQALVLLVSSAIKRKHKRIDYLIREAATLRQLAPGLVFRLVIAGGREDETEELIQLARSTLGDDVVFAAAFSRDRMPELYRMADALIHGSLKEMMPMALLEATASGLPCFVHRHPVMKWMIGPGGEALDLQHAGALAHALRNFSQSFHLQQDLSRRARAHCVQHFESGKIIEQILNYYQVVHQYGAHLSRDVA